MQGLKSGIFSEQAGMAVPCQCNPQESLAGIQKLFLFWVPINPQKDWKVKLERAHFSKVESGKITVCSVHTALALESLHGIARARTPKAAVLFIFWSSFPHKQGKVIFEVVFLSSCIYVFTKFHFKKDLNLQSFLSPNINQALAPLQCQKVKPNS